MVSLTFLGTSGMAPTKERNLSSLYIETQGQGLLFDCGEGTQRQILYAGVKRYNIKHIFISHWHADHISGLMGLMQTMSNRDINVKLTIHGPMGTKTFMDHILKSSIWEQNIDITIQEHEGTTLTPIYHTSDFSVYTIALNHSTPVLGYRFVQHDKRRVYADKLKALGIEPGPIYAQLQEGKDIQVHDKTYDAQTYTYIVPGKIIAIIFDTGFCPACVELAQDADVLVCESTFSVEHEQKALERKHLTSVQAAQIANLAQVKTLYLTHFSQRYTNIDQLLQEAKDVFDKTYISYDLKTINV